MRKQRKSPRKGAVLICVLTCMLVAMSLVATAIQMSIRSRRECKMAQQMRQTELLADAGQSRAIASLLDASEYVGESWRPKLEITSLGKATVEIAVVQEAPLARVIVTAKLQSTESALSITQRTRTFTVQLSNLTAVE